MDDSKDSLGKFDFSKFTGGGLYVKFEAGKPLTLRVLTTDPIVSTKEFTDPKTEEVTLSTKFSFIVYNWTDEKAQILSASPGVAKKISELHVDDDFGANIRNIDIKITPTGEQLRRKYDIQVLPKTQKLTSDQIKEAQGIDLDEKVEGDRMSIYDPEERAASAEVASASKDEDTEIEDINDEPINMDDIPF